MSLENMKDEMKWLLFRGIVCHLLEKHEYNGNPWLFSGCLDMSFEELYDVIIDLEERLINIALYNYDVIYEDEELTAIFEEASDAYDKVYEDYVAINDSMESGSLPVQLMRNLRKSTEALAKAVDALEAAVPGTNA